MSISIGVSDSYGKAIRCTDGSTEEREEEQYSQGEVECWDVNNE
jgi:hypothetical protein